MSVVHKLEPLVCLYGLFVAVASQEDEVTDEPSGEEETMDWRLILAYVCFAIGGVLLLFGFIRLIIYVCSKRKRHNGSTESGKDLVRDYYSSPWLKGNTYANRNNMDDDILQDVDVNAFYSLPADANTLDREQRRRDQGEDITDDPIYSIPHDNRALQIDEDDLAANATYSEPVKPRGSSAQTASDETLQTLHVSRLTERQQQQQQQSDTASVQSQSNTYNSRQLQQQQQTASELNQSTATSTAAALSALDAATSGEQAESALYETIQGTEYSYVESDTRPKQYMHIDRTLAEEKEIEYTFSSSVYVHTF